jgi:hypothetical protein
MKTFFSSDSAEKRIGETRVAKREMSVFSSTSNEGGETVVVRCSLRNRRKGIVVIALGWLSRVWCEGEKERRKTSEAVLPEASSSIPFSLLGEQAATKANRTSQPFVQNGTRERDYQNRRKTNTTQALLGDGGRRAK